MSLFSELGLSNELVKAVEDLGFTQPTAIQGKAIPYLIQNTGDFIGLAQTGTGKTAAFGLPMLQNLDSNERVVQGLVICPTRELCLQIAKDLDNFMAYIPALKVVPVYGGSSIETQIREIKKGAQVIVATPGRLIDLLERGAVRLNHVHIVILDEADEMLNMGFKEDLNTILEQTPESKNTWLFSATMPQEVRSIAKNYMSNPFEVTVGTKNTTNENIEHIYYLARAKDKYQSLKRLLDFNPEIYSIVFAKTKLDCQEISDHLMKDGYNADALHGDLSQAQRDRVMERFRNKSLQILVATDVAARGIDVDNITHVINYSLPDELEVYTHRSGRTARAGKKGICMSIVHSKELFKIKQLENKTKTKFTKGNIPSGKEVCEKQLFALIHQVHEVQVNDHELEEYLPSIYNELADLSREEIIKKFASIEFNRFLNYYKNAADLNSDGKSSDREERTSGDFSRLFMSIGEKDGLDKTGLLRLLNQHKLTQIKVGKINIRDSYSFFEVNTDGVDELFDTLNGADFHGRKLKIEMASDAKPRGGDRRSGGGGGRRDDRRDDRRGGDRDRGRGGDSNRRSSNSRGGERRGGGDRFNNERGERKRSYSKA